MDDTRALAVVDAPPAPLAVALGLDEDGARRLYEAFRAGRNGNTRRAYEQSADDFAGFLSRRTGRPYDATGALHELLRSGLGGANLLALDYRADLLARAAPGTVALRLSNLRAACKLARTLGLVTWHLEVEGVKVQRYRDTAGPGVAGVQALANAARARTDVLGTRDRALIALLFFQGLRRGEVASLDLEHVDAEGCRLSVLGKGQLEREWVAAAPEAIAAVKAWLEVHPGLEEGCTVQRDHKLAPNSPLFLGWDATTRQAGGRLTGDGIAKIVGRYGLQALGAKVRPHGLRHTAVTALLDLGLSWAEVAGFTRHADPSTLRHYDDARGRRGARAARRLAELVTV